MKNKTPDRSTRPQSAGHDAQDATSYQLSPQDAQVVDLLLDADLTGSTATDGAFGGWGAAGLGWGMIPQGGNAAENHTMTGFTATNSTTNGANSLAGRMDAADRLLKLLDHLPADEPPATLLAATMRRVEEARAAGKGDSSAARVSGQPTTGTGHSLTRDLKKPNG